MERVDPDEVAAKLNGLLEEENSDKQQKNEDA